MRHAIRRPAFALALAATCLLTTAALAGGRVDDGRWLNPGEPIACDFTPGRHSVIGYLKTAGCDPNTDRECGFTLDVVGVKKDHARDWEARETVPNCRIEISNPRLSTVRPMWRKSHEGKKLMRVTGLVTDGKLTITRGRVLTVGSPTR